MTLESYKKPWRNMVTASHIPQGKFYFVDSGYPNRLGYLAPYRNTRYHLSAFNNGSMPEGMQELFNYRHSQLRNAVEHAFGMCKGKWRILDKISKYKSRRQCAIITACMALHNFIIDYKLAAGAAGNMPAQAAGPSAPPASAPSGLSQGTDAELINMTHDCIAASLVA